MNASTSQAGRLDRVRARRRAAVILSGAVLGTLPSMAPADTLTWAGNGGANSWSLTGNWLNSTGGASVPQNGDSIFFNGAPPFASNFNDLSGLSVSSVTFTAAATSFTLGGNNLALSGSITDSSTNAQTINLPLTLSAPATMFVDTGGSLTINGQISESAQSSLTKTGAGSLALGANNTYTGNTIIAAGTLVYNVDQTGVKTLVMGGSAGSATVGSLNLANANLTATGFNAQTNSTSANLITIGSGKTLTVNGNVVVGNLATADNVKTLVTMTGGGALSVSNTGGSFIVRNTSTAEAIPPTGGTSGGILDVSGLNSFTYNSGTGGGSLAIGDANKGTGTLILAATGTNPTNTITTPLVTLGGDDGSQGDFGVLTLGPSTNVINANTINVGFTKGWGLLQFGNTSGSLKIRGVNAGEGDRANITIANRNGSTGSNPGTGSILLEGHSVDIMADTIQVGSTSAATENALFKFDTGIINTNNLFISTRTGGTVNGEFDIGGTAQLQVNSGITLLNSPSATTSTAVFKINGGAVSVGGDIGEAGSNFSGLSTLVLNGGLLDMHGHNIGTASTAATGAIDTLTFLGGTLQNVGAINVTGGVNMTGTGQLVLDGTNSFIGNTTATAGTIRINNGLAAQNSVLAPTATGVLAFAPSVGNFTVGGITGAANLALADVNGAAINLSAGNNNGTQTYSGGLTGSGSFTKIGTGRIILSGSNSYSGGTNVNNGTLAVTGGLLSTGTVAVNSGGNLAGNMATGKSLGNVTLNSNGTIVTGQDGIAGILHANTLDIKGGTMQFNLGATTSSSFIDATTVAVDSSFNINIPISAGGMGTYTLVQSGSNIAYNGNTISLSSPGGGFNYALDTTTDPKFIFLKVTGQVLHLTWSGAGDGNSWDTSTGNWTNTDSNTTSQTYTDPAAVTFDDSGSGTSINLNIAVLPASVTVGGNNNNYTINGGGSIGGIVTPLVKNGNSTFSLFTSNSFGGGTTVNGGTIVINSANSLGAQTGALTLNAGTLEVQGGVISSTRNINLGAATSAISVDGGNTYTVGGIVADASGTTGTLNAIGSGTLVLNGVNTYTGGTKISGGGTVQINSASSLGAGSVTIGSGTLDATANIVSTRTVVLTAPNSTIGAETNVTYNLNSVIADAPSFTTTLNKAGAGILALGATNTFSGGVKVLGGTVAITDDTNLGAVPSTPTPNNIILGSGGTNTGVLAVNSTMTLNSNRGIGLNGTGTINVAASQTFTYAGIVADSNATGVFGIAGTGTTILSGTSTYTGTTGTSGGTLILTAGINHLPNGSINLGGTSVLVLGDATGPASQTFAGLGSGGANATPSVLGGSSSVSTLIDTNSGTIQYSRGIGGPGTNQNNIAFVFSGSGTLRLNASSANADNTYTGGTTINSGTLAATQIHSLGAVTGLVTLNGGTMGINVGTTTASGISAYNVSIPDNVNVNISTSRNGNGAGFLQTLGNLSIGFSTLNVTSDASVTSGNAQLAFSGPVNLTSTGNGTTAFVANNDLLLTSVTGSATTGNVTTLQLDGNVSGTSTGSSISGTISPGSGGGKMALYKTGNGMWTIAGNATYTAGTTIQNGTLLTTTNFSNGTLNLQGGTAKVAHAPNNNESDHVTLVPSLNVNGGNLDLTNNALIVDYAVADGSPLSNLKSSLASGYNNGAWNGSGIQSSSAANIASEIAAGSINLNRTAIGYAEASALGINNFHGYIVDGSAVVMAYTLAGDANLDGKVNALDFNALATNYGVSDGSAVWRQGDYDFNGNVDTSDFTLLAQNFNAQLVAPGPGTPVLGALVPEPAAVCVIAAAALLLRRRRNFRKS